MPGIKRFVTGVAVLALGVLTALPVSATAHAAAKSATAAGSSSKAATTASSPLDRRTRTNSSHLSSAAAWKAAITPDVVIGVDNASPPGKNWEYTSFFPSSGVSVATGKTILFVWNPGSLNGFHSVTLLPTGTTPAADRAANPILQADTDNGETNPVTLAGNNNPSSFTCGQDPTQPACPFDGTTAPVSSGDAPNTVGVAFPVTITAPPGTYTYICRVHQNMQGTITVTSATTTDVATLASESQTELNNLNTAAGAQEAALSTPSSTLNPDGTRTWTQNVGGTATSGTDHVELLEFLPLNLPIQHGDTVKFATTTAAEIHTASIPLGPTGFALGPFPPHNDCEVASGPDTAAANVNGPPELGCADPSTIELPLIMGPQGAPSVISSGQTAASSGVLTGVAAAYPLGASASHSYSFPHNGTYVFFCQFHFGMEGIVNTPGYRLVGKDGGVFDFGGMDFFGSKGGQGINTVVAIVNTPDGQGYWLIGANGAVYNFGDAASFGDLTRFHLNAPIVGAALTADGGGLYLIGGDGGVFTLGDAVFRGSTGSLKLNKPVVGIAVEPFGGGYWLVAADGGVFTFGVPFLGSTGSLKLNKPVIGILATFGGYYLFASDGGVFTFNVPFLGSLGSFKLNAPIVGLSLTVDFSGYRLVATDGGVFDFNAPFFGSLGSFHLNSPINGIAGT